MQGEREMRTDVRVIMTGIGTISPLGLDVETTWRKLIACKSGVTLFDRFDTSQFRTKIAAMVDDFDPTDFVSPKEAKRMDRFVQFASASTTEALGQADLAIDEQIADDVEPRRLLGRAGPTAPKVIFARGVSVGVCGSSA
jgi:3-oxoacyl-(acyl-carrier-protein) synthase